MIIELGSSNIVTDSVNNEVIKFMFTCYVYVVRLRGKEAEGIIEIRMRQYNENKIKTTQVILRDPNSLIQRIERANIQIYYWVHCMNKDIKKCDPCLSGWKRKEETGTLITLWYDCN